jgi:hypothetical protein
MTLATTTYFPGFGLSRLRILRGNRWEAIVDWVSKLPASDPQVMAMTLTIRRVRRANHIETSCRDPFCAVCASQVVAQYPGSEQQLIDLYHANVAEMRACVGNMRMRERMPLAGSLQAAA